jgi:hypothetical protein
METNAKPRSASTTCNREVVVVMPVNVYGLESCNENK